MKIHYKPQITKSFFDSMLVDNCGSGFGHRGFRKA